MEKVKETRLPTAEEADFGRPLLDEMLKNTTLSFTTTMNRCGSLDEHQL